MTAYNSIIYPLLVIHSAALRPVAVRIQPGWATSEARQWLWLCTHQCGGAGDKRTVAATIREAAAGFGGAVVESRGMMDGMLDEARKARLRRAGMVDGLMDCLYLLSEDGLGTAGLQQALTRWLGAPGAAGLAGIPRLDRFWTPEQLVDEGMRDSYAACRQWLAQGLQGADLAALIVQRTFAVWPREPADYQRRYDAFLEKALENTHATYYPSSSEWIDAVDVLCAEVSRADAMGQAPDAKLLERCLKLLDTRSHRQPVTVPACGQVPTHAGTRERIAGAVAFLWQRLPAAGAAPASRSVSR